MISNLIIKPLDNDPNKNEIIVPKGIRFISNWTDYNLNDFQFPHILDKKIPGCGYTEYAIRNNLNIILCSPRKMLLENKQQQHPNEVFYFHNELESDIEYDKDLMNTKHVPKEIIITSEEKRRQVLENLSNQLKSYITFCICKEKPAKILVTYDSFRLVKEILKENNRFDDFYIVVDEFQSVLVDAKFKSSTELDFLNQLQGIKKVCYVSATPMIDKYLKDISEFSALPYFELNWVEQDPLRAIKPDLKIRVTQSVVTTTKGIIDKYLKGEFECFTGGDGLTIYSKEAVFYLNSVNNILSIIKKMSLSPDQVNILCANTPDNRKKIINKLGADFKIGRVPLKGEKNKMFTFCTRTVYLGADFYSDNARTFILSDANIDALAVDISLDLPQILGRQRLNTNPWKNRAEFWYKTLRPGKVMTREDFDVEIKRKSQNTEDLLLSYSTTPTDQAKTTLANVYKDRAEDRNYREDYIAVNKYSGSTLYPVINYLVKVAERRAFDIQQTDYKDRFTVFNTISDSGLVSGNSVQFFLSQFEFFTNFPDKMRYLCESLLSDEERCVILDQIPLTYKNFYLTIGPDRCKANGYDISRIKKEYDDLCMDKTNLTNKIVSEFLVGNRYLMTDIKEKLREIYNQVGLNKTPKATDLDFYFNIKKANIKVGDKRVQGFEIISKK